MTQWFVYIPAGFFFQVEFLEVNFRGNFAVNPFRFIGKISTWKKIPGGKICIFRLILLLYIAFHLYSISCEGKKNPPVFFLRFHVFKFTWIPAGRFRTGDVCGIYIQMHSRRANAKITLIRLLLTLCIRETPQWVLLQRSPR